MDKEEMEWLKGAICGVIAGILTGVAIYFTMNGF